MPDTILFSNSYYKYLKNEPFLKQFGRVVILILPTLFQATERVWRGGSRWLQQRQLSIQRSNVPTINSFISRP